MPKVSCRLFTVAFVHMPDAGLSVEQWCEGLPTTAEHLGNPKATISWELFVTLLDRLQEMVGGPESFESYVIDDFGYVVSSSLMAVFRTASAPLQVYRVFTWMQRSFVSGLTSTLEVVDGEHLRINQTFGEELEINEAVWVAGKAMLRGLPTLLGLPEAHVELSGSGRSRSFEIWLPPSGSVGARFRRAWRAFWGLEPSFALISAQKDELVRHYAELEAELERREQAEAQLRHAQKLEVLGQLAGGVAHDFNNVLAVVLGSVEMLELEVQDRPRLTELVVDARTAIEAGASLTRSLVSLSRREAARPERCDLRVIVERSATLLQRLLPSYVRLEVSIPLGVWLCELDRGQLQNAVLNLVINAGHAIDGEGEVRLELGDAAPGFLRLSVVDDGPGMSAEVLARAAEPFFTTKPEGGGTGLGLAMVSSFAEDSEGEMLIESVPGEGCRVCLILPRA